MVGLVSGNMKYVYMQENVFYLSWIAHLDAIYQLINVYLQYSIITHGIVQ